MEDSSRYLSCQQLIQILEESRISLPYSLKNNHSGNQWIEREQKDFQKSKRLFKRFFKYGLLPTLCVLGITWFSNFDLIGNTLITLLLLGVWLYLTGRYYSDKSDLERCLNEEYTNLNSIVTQYTNTLYVQVEKHNKICDLLTQGLLLKKYISSTPASLDQTLDRVVNILHEQSEALRRLVNCYNELAKVPADILAKMQKVLATEFDFGTTTLEQFETDLNMTQTQAELELLLPQLEAIVELKGLLSPTPEGGTVCQTNASRIAPGVSLSTQ